MKCHICGRNFNGNYILEKEKIRKFSLFVKNVENLRVCRECLFWGGVSVINKIKSVNKRKKRNNSNQKR